MNDALRASSILVALEPYVRELVREQPYTMSSFHRELRALAARHPMSPALKYGRYEIVIVLFRANILRSVGRDSYVMVFPVTHHPSRIRPHRTGKKLQRIRRTF